jgi:hypothetical protein
MVKMLQVVAYAMGLVYTLMERLRCVVDWGVSQLPRSETMAKKKVVPKVPVATAKRKAPNRSGRPVRLDLTEKDHDRMERHATRRGLSKASLARMVILAWLEEQEGGAK